MSAATQVWARMGSVVQRAKITTARMHGPCRRRRHLSTTQHASAHAARVIDMRSDTITTPSPEMRQLMVGLLADAYPVLSCPVDIRCGAFLPWSVRPVHVELSISNMAHLLARGTMAI